MQNTCANRRSLFALAIVALWPVWQWSMLRSLDASGEAWELMSLATVVFLLSRVARHDMPACIDLLLPGLLLLLYAALFAWLPPLLRAAIGMSALAATLSTVYFGKRMHLAIWALLLLSLPVIASLNFYLGYPLRAFAGSVTAALLQMNGLAVVREGTLLKWGSQLIAIDAPCSGVKMLWTGLYLAATLALVQRLDSWKTIQLAILSLGAVLGANILRATALFYVDANLVVVLKAWHSEIGIAAFVMGAVVIALLARGFAKGKQFSATDVRPTADHLPLFGISCLMAAVIPLFTSQPPLANNNGTVIWPTQFEGRQLHALPLTSLEQRFADSFPGHIARFSDGKREIIVRRVAQETRKLHPAADCFKGSGYSVQPQPLSTDHEGVRWGNFFAQRGSDTMWVRERIYDDAGNNWTDVSTWYWSALWRQSRGPWWAVVVAAQIESTHGGTKNPVVPSSK